MAVPCALRYLYHRIIYRMQSLEPICHKISSTTYTFVLSSWALSESLPDLESLLLKPFLFSAELSPQWPLIVELTGAQRMEAVFSISLNIIHTSLSSTTITL